MASGIIYSCHQECSPQCMHLYLTVEKQCQVLWESSDHATLIKAIEVDASWPEYHVVHSLFTYFAELQLNFLCKRC